MASSGYGNYILSSEAVQVLVDESPMVREASMAALKDVAPLWTEEVWEYCGFISINVGGIRALDECDVEPSYMTKLSKIATAELISSKEFNADWKRDAASVPVAIGLHLGQVFFQLFMRLRGLLAVQCGLPYLFSY